MSFLEGLLSRRVFSNQSMNGREPICLDDTSWSLLINVHIVHAYVRHDSSERGWLGAERFGVAKCIHLRDHGVCEGESCIVICSGMHVGGWVVARIRRHGEGERVNIFVLGAWPGVARAGYFLGIRWEGRVSACL